MAPRDSFIMFGTYAQENRLLWLSPTAYDVLGYEPEELIGAPLNKIIYPDDQADVEDVRKEHYKDDHIAGQITCRFRRKDGAAVHCVGFVSLCYDFSIGIAAMLGSDAEACKSDQLRRVESQTFTSISLEEVSQCAMTCQITHFP
jgi:PAS domain S-box-containing protein